MTYGTIKVDTVTFTDAGIDKSVTLSGLVQNPTFSGNVTVTGTLSGVTVTGTTANFTSGNFTNISGGTHTITSGVFAAGSAASPSITFTGDLNTGIYSPGADQVAISTGGSGRLFVDASGRVGVGTSPSYALHVSGTGTVSSRTLATDATGDASFFVQNDGNGICGPLVYGSTKTAYGALASNETAFYSNRSTTIMADGGSAVIKFATGGNTERARIDSSGRLLVGTSSARNVFDNLYAPRLQVEGTDATHVLSVVINTASTDGSYLFLGKSRGASAGSNSVVQNGDRLGAIVCQGADGAKLVRAAQIEAFVDGTPGTDDMPGRLVFSTTADGASSPTERMRISSAGQTYVVSTYYGATIISTETAGTSVGLIEGKHSGTAGSITGATTSFTVWTNGNVVNTNNSYGAISDIKLKENIVDAGSQWDDIRALQIRKYNFKEGQTHTQIGLIAQEVELVSPGLVTESPDRDKEGNDLGTVTKSVNYSVLYMKAVKALQEAMERIETLEAKVAALESA